MTTIVNNLFPSRLSVKLFLLVALIPSLAVPCGQYVANEAIETSVVRRVPEARFTLHKALLEEYSIWNTIYPGKYFHRKQMRGFFHAPFPKVKHWNVVYPLVPDVIPTERDLEAFQKWYSELGIQGNFIDTSGSFKSRRPEANLVYSYFLAEGDRKREPSMEGSLIVQKTDDMMLFGRVVTEAFNLDQRFIDDFRKKMEKLRRATESRFYLVYDHGVPCAAASSYLTAGGYQFIMNVGVIPSHRRQDIGKYLIRHILSDVSGPVLIRTDNQSLMGKLNELNFSYLGKTYTVPVDRALRMVRRIFRADTRAARELR